VVCCCERGNEPSGYIKCGEFLGQLGKCWRLKMYSAQQVNSVGRSVGRLVCVKYRRQVSSGMFGTITRDVMCLS